MVIFTKTSGGFLVNTTMLLEQKDDICSISWNRSIFQSIKKQILRFHFYNVALDWLKNEYPFYWLGLLEKPNSYHNFFFEVPKNLAESFIKNVFFETHFLPVFKREFLDWQK